MKLNLTKEEQKEYVKKTVHNSSGWMAPPTPIKHNPAMRIDSFTGQGRSVWNASGNINPQDLGYDYTLQTVTAIATDVVQTSYYDAPIADYVDVNVGFGAWMENIKINTVVNNMQNFASGFVSTSASMAEIVKVNVGLVAVPVNIKTWQAGYDYSIIEINKALASNNWSIVESLSVALKQFWDTGVIQFTFLGDPQDNADFPGLLNNPTVEINTALISQNISSMSPTQFSNVIAGLIPAFQNNANFTVYPDTFVMPQDDYNGLAVPTSAAYPYKNMLEYLLESFKLISRNQNFKILPSPYAMGANNYSGLQTYALYARRPDCVRMYIPVQFQMNPAATMNNVNWQAVAQGQLASPVVIKPDWMLYFTHA